MKPEPRLEVSQTLDGGGHLAFVTRDHFGMILDLDPIATFPTPKEAWLAAMVAEAMAPIEEDAL